jgi:hypothetical protein
MENHTPFAGMGEIGAAERVNGGRRAGLKISAAGSAFRLQKAGIRAILRCAQKSKCRRIFIPSLQSVPNGLYCKHRRLLVCLSTRLGAPSDFLSTSIKPDEYLTGEPND